MMEWAQDHAYFKMGMNVGNLIGVVGVNASARLYDEDDDLVARITLYNILYQQIKLGNDNTLFTRIHQRGP